MPQRARGTLTEAQSRGEGNGWTPNPQRAHQGGLRTGWAGLVSGWRTPRQRTQPGALWPVHLGRVDGEVGE